MSTYTENDFDRVALEEMFKQKDVTQMLLEMGLHIAIRPIKGNKVLVSLCEDIKIIRAAECDFSEIEMSTMFLVAYVLDLATL